MVAKLVRFAPPEQAPTIINFKFQPKQHHPLSQARSERTVSGAELQAQAGDVDSAELNHVKLAKSKFGDGLASDMLKKAESSAAVKLAGGGGAEQQVKDAVDESTDVSTLDESIYSSPLKDESEEEEEEEEEEKVVEEEEEEVVMEEEVREMEEVAVAAGGDETTEPDVSVDVVEAAEGLLAEGVEAEGEKPKESGA